MNQIFCRSHDSIRIEKPFYRYKNFRIDFVDGKRKIIECDPVTPSLAAEHSVMMNALINRNRVPRQPRISCDAVDLAENLNL